ncbi:DinB family protein [Gemmatimonas sp.]|jgi:hypothetical protein|uniref:DinB family protein n=1 Tax=Gemmatimonas sp. TaxID=1962908 RepID=UPI0037C0B844
MTDRWQRALVEHDDVFDEYLHVARAFTADRWQRAPAPGRWSAAALTLHVADAYRYGHEAACGGPGMRLLVPPLAAFASRVVIFPVMRWLKRFPREAPAPNELRPDLTLVHTMTQAEVVDRLEHEAGKAIAAFQRPTAARVMHAYFGSLTPYQTLQLVTAHTRHHTIGLRERLTAD